MENNGIDIENMSLMVPVSFEYPYALGYNYIFPTPGAEYFPKCMPGSPFQAPSIGRFSYDIRSGDILMVTHGGKPSSIGLHSVFKVSPSVKRHDIITVPPIQYSWPYLPKTVLWKISTYGKLRSPLEPIHLENMINSLSKYGIPDSRDQSVSSEMALQTAFNAMASTIRGGFDTPEFNIDMLLPGSLNMHSTTTKVKFGAIDIGRVDNQRSLRLRESFATCYYMSSLTVTHDAPLLKPAATIDFNNNSQKYPPEHDMADVNTNRLENTDAVLGFNRAENIILSSGLVENNSKSKKSFIDDSPSSLHANRNLDIPELGPAFFEPFGGDFANSNTSFDLDLHLTPKNTNTSDHSDKSIINNAVIISDTLPANAHPDSMSITFAPSPAPQPTSAPTYSAEIPATNRFQKCENLNVVSPFNHMETTNTFNCTSQSTVDPRTGTFTSNSVNPNSSLINQNSSTAAPVPVSTTNVFMRENDNVSKIATLAPRPTPMDTSTAVAVSAVDELQRNAAEKNEKNMDEEAKRRKELAEARKRRNRLSAAKCNERKKQELEKLKRETQVQKERVRELHEKRLLAKKENELLKAALVAKFSAAS